MVTFMLRVLSGGSKNDTYLNSRNPRAVTAALLTSSFTSDTCKIRKAIKRNVWFRLTQKYETMLCSKYQNRLQNRLFIELFIYYNTFFEIL